MYPPFCFNNLTRGQSGFVSPFLTPSFNCIETSSNILFYLWTQRKKERKWSRSVMSDSLRPHGHQVPPSMRFSRQEYWNGLPLRITQTLIVAVSKLASLTICLLFQSVAMAATVLHLLMKNSSCSLSSLGTRRTQWEQQLWPKQVFSTQVSQQFAPSSCVAAHWSPTCTLWSWACI